MAKLTEEIKRMLNALAYAHAGEYLSLHQKIDHLNLKSGSGNALPTNVPVPVPDVVHVWKLKETDKGRITLRLRMENKDGGYAQRILHLKLDYTKPTPTPTDVPPTDLPPTDTPPTETPPPPTETPISPTDAPPTETPTDIPVKTRIPPIETPVPPTDIPPTELPPTP